MLKILVCVGVGIGVGVEEYVENICVLVSHSVQTLFAMRRLAGDSHGLAESKTVAGIS